MKQKFNEYSLVLFIMVVLGFTLLAAKYKGTDAPTTETNVAPVESVQEQNYYGASLAIRGAIRFKANNPNAVEFVKMTYEWKSDSVWVQKWLINGKNEYGAAMQGYGLARVRYNGKGSRRSEDSWDVEESSIETLVQ
jgi:hypothetical protein